MLNWIKPFWLHIFHLYSIHTLSLLPRSSEIYRQTGSLSYCPTSRINQLEGNLYLGVDRLAHGDAGTLQSILSHTEVTALVRQKWIYNNNNNNNNKNNIKITVRVTSKIRGIQWL